MLFMVPHWSKGVKQRGELEVTCPVGKVGRDPVTPPDNCPKGLKKVYTTPSARGSGKHIEWRQDVVDCRSLRAELCLLSRSSLFGH